MEGIQFLINGLIAGSIYALVAIGFALIYRVTKFFHFAHGAVLTIAAYSTYFFTAILKFPLLGAAIISVVIATFSGGMIDLLVYRPMRARKASSLVLLLASLGVFIVVQNFISLFFGDDPLSIRGGGIEIGVNIVGARIMIAQLRIVVASAILSAITAYALQATRFGKTLRAVANDRELALISGIDTERVIFYTFLLGSALAACAAILIALDSALTPLVSINILFMAIVAMIIGGAGSIIGSLAGGIFLGVVQNLTVWVIGSQWQITITFTILLLFLLFRPYGFLGRPKEARV